MKTAIILFIIGILISATTLSQSSNIVLNSENHFTFFGPVEEGSVKRAQIEFSLLDNDLPKDKVIYMVLNTPGGSLGDGEVLINYMKASKRHVKVICLYCASMGYNFFQAFNERIVLSSSILMMHPATVMVQGKYPHEFNSRLSPVKDMIHRFDVHNAKRIKTTVPKYQAMIDNEVNLNGHQAVEQNHADSMAIVSCAPELMERKLKYVFFESGVRWDFVRSGCPLITQSLETKKSSTQSSSPSKTFNRRKWSF